MGEKTAGVGHFAIPTAPAAGTSCTSGAANTFTTTYVQLIASTGAAIYITGLFVESATALGGTYDVVQLATGAAAAEVVVGQYLIALSTGTTIATGYRPIYPPIPVANGIRIACKTADSVGAKATLITLECINQSNVVDDGVAVGTVTTVTNQLTAAQIATGVWQDATAGDFTTASSIGKALYISNVAPGAAGGHFIAGTNAATTITTGLTTTFTGNLTGSVASVTGAVGSVTGAVGSVTGAVGSVTGAVGSVTGAVGSVTGLTASNLDATVSSRMATYTQPTGFLAATFPTGTVANTTNITAGTITTATTATNLTNLPSIPANWLTAAGIAAAALNGKGDWNIGKTGYSLTQTFPANFSALAVTAGGAVTAGTVSDKTGYALTQTFPANFSAAVISAAGVVDGNIKSVAGTTVNGVGTAGNPWGP